MAFWGAPLPQEDYIMHAAKAAIDMVEESKAMSEELMKAYGRTVSFGIGIQIGPAVVGNIGATNRMDYTAIGDTVNTAARLESLAPSGCIYISRAVADALEGRVKVTSLADSIQLKGKSEGFENCTKRMRGNNMELTTHFENMGFSMVDTSMEDLDDFILVEKISHNKYVVEHSDFFGDWNEEILISSFSLKRKFTFFKKLLCNNEVVGFYSYDEKVDKIDNVFIRIIEKSQKKGLGVWFLSSLIKLAEELDKPIFLTVIKTNPAQNLYKRLGFELYEEKDAFYFFKYNPQGGLEY